MEFVLIFTVAVSFSTFISIVLFSIIVKFHVEFRYEDRPILLIVYLKALWLGLRRKHTSKLYNGFPSEKQNMSNDSRFKIIARDCRIDWRNLQYYGEICGYATPMETVPPCYLENYFVILVAVLVTHDQFLLSPLGLIHLHQTITQHTGLEHLIKEPFDLECGLSGYRKTERGIEVDLTMRVYDRREMCVWEGLCTLLSRNAATLSHSRTHCPSTDVVDSDDTRKNESFRLDLPGYLGRQYAWASGDWNPHHLWRWSAVLLGFQQPIAHGMWTLSRTLAHLQTSGLFALKPPFHVAAHFKRPIFLPSSSVFKFMRQTDKDLLCFRVEAETVAVPQLVGNVHRQ